MKHHRNTTRQMTTGLILGVFVLILLISALSSLLVSPIHPMECNQGIFEKILENTPNNTVGCNREQGLFYFNPDTLGIDKE